MTTAHAYLHFAFGLVAGTLIAVRPLGKRWVERRALYPGFAWWFCLSYGLGLWAVLPSLARNAGLPEIWLRGWWMNIFLLHPLVDRLRPGGMLIGQMLICGIVTLQYGGLTLTVLACRGKKRRHV